MSKGLLPRSVSSGLGLALAVVLSACQPTFWLSWSTYHNGRYDFEFPYPSHWQALPMPDNRAGRTFVHPQEPGIKITGWAQHRLSNLELESSLRSTPFKRSEFTTAQGITGILQVEIGDEVSVMALTIVQDRLEYIWQASVPNERFEDYYQLFYRMASQYRIEQDATQFSVHEELVKTD